MNPVCLFIIYSTNNSVIKHLTQLILYRPFDMDNSQHRLIKFPKLKQLSIDMQAMPPHLLKRIDCVSCSDNLLNLELKNLGFEGYRPSTTVRMDDFIKSLKSLRKLRSCSLPSLIKYPEIFEIILQFKELRFESLSFME